MEGSGLRCRVVLGEGERSKVEGSGLRWEAVSGRGERSQVEGPGSGLRWREAIAGGC